MDSDIHIRVSDIMQRHVQTIPKDAKVSEAIALMKSNHISTLIIKPDNSQDNYGIITERDIVYQVVARRRNPHQITISEIMRSPCIVLYADLDIFEAAQRLSEGGIQRAPVLGFSQQGDDQLLGIVSITDIINVFDLELFNPNEPLLV